ncbi:MAG: DNA recombination protein RmuC, partial [Desulfobacterales bacterium]|nr:DNA recombination protein RmuC [Desulfobacterales bacterium]
ELFEYAIDNKVLVSSPVVLFALLKAVAFGWQQHQIAENAKQIADQGKTLYDRILKFVEYL